MNNFFGWEKFVHNKLCKNVKLYLFLKYAEQQKLMCISYVICNIYYMKVYLQNWCWEIVISLSDCRCHVEKLSTSPLKYKKIELCMNFKRKYGIYEKNYVFKRRCTCTTWYIGTWPSSLWSRGEQEQKNHTPPPMTSGRRRSFLVARAIRILTASWKSRRIDAPPPPVDVISQHEHRHRAPANPLPRTRTNPCCLREASTRATPTRLRVKKTAGSERYQTIRRFRPCLVDEI